MTLKTAINMITNKETLDLFISCSKATFCTPETLLSQLDINPLEVIDSQIRLGIDESLRITHKFSLTVQNEKTVVFSQPLFELSRPIAEIQTLHELADELSELTNENGVIVIDGNEYDMIAEVGMDKVDFDMFFTIYNSWEYSKVDVPKLLLTLKDSYGIQIERSAITKFNGTVEELCNALTKRINKSIDFKKHNV